MKNIFSRNDALIAGIITLLLFTIDRLAHIGIPYNIAFVFVFLIVDLAVLRFINMRLIEIYGNIRAVKLFVYGIGAVVIFFMVLKLFGVN